jgi:hypothetical protein
MPLSLHDAFVVPLYCGEVGIPMFGMQMLNSLGVVSGELGQRVGELRAVYQNNGANVGGQIVEVERILAGAQLPVPARPNSFADYMKWSDATCKAVLDATGPTDPAGATAAFARALGEMIQAVAIAITILDLRRRAPTHDTLQSYDTQTIERLVTCQRRLDGMSTFSTLPPAVRPRAEELAAFARQSAALQPEPLETREAGLKLVFHKLAEHTGQLAASLKS